MLLMLLPVLKEDFVEELAEILFDLFFFLLKWSLPKNGSFQRVFTF